jgi:hypothetical protein
VNKWLDIVACNTSYHSLAIFYSLLNTALSYDPVGWGMPYNHVIFTDSREGLADTSLQVRPSTFCSPRELTHSRNTAHAHGRHTTHTGVGGAAEPRALDSDHAAGRRA